MQADIDNYCNVVASNKVMGIIRTTENRFYTRQADEPFFTIGPGLHTLHEAVKKCAECKADYIQFNSCCHNALMPIDEALKISSTTFVICAECGDPIENFKRDHQADTGHTFVEVWKCYCEYSGGKLWSATELKTYRG